MKYVKERDKLFNHQTLYRFNNDYGASVVIGPYTYGGELGLKELAVLKFTPDEEDKFEIDYTTPITNDVVGSCTDAEIEELLAQIENLPLKGADENAEETTDSK
jgi:hypothetical protein